MLRQHLWPAHDTPPSITSFQTQTFLLLIIDEEDDEHLENLSSPVVCDHETSGSSENGMMMCGSEDVLFGDHVEKKRGSCNEEQLEAENRCGENHRGEDHHDEHDLHEDDHNCNDSCNDSLEVGEEAVKPEIMQEVMRRTTSVRSTKSAACPTQFNMQQQQHLHQFPGCSHLVGNNGMDDDSVKIMESIDGPLTTTEVRPLQSLHEEQTPVDHDANSCTHAHFLAQQFTRTYQQKAEDAMQDMMTKSIQVVTKTAASAPGASMGAATTGGGTTCSSTMNYHQQQYQKQKYPLPISKRNF